MMLPADARFLLIARGLRAFVDGFVCILLPANPLALGLGAHGHRFHHHPLLLAAGLGFRRVDSRSS